MIKNEDSHITALRGGFLDQHFWSLPLLHAGIFLLSGLLVLPGVDPVQTPELGCQLLTDQNVAGPDVSMQEVFAVKELLMVQQETKITGLNRLKDM